MIDAKMISSVERKNVIGLGIFKSLNVISSDFIKGYGAVFIYTISGSLNFVFYYLFIYSITQILTNLIFKKLFSKNPKLALILRVIPFLFMFGIFFTNTTPWIFTIIISISNGVMNSFYIAPMDNINGQLKSVQKPGGQSFMNYFEYFGIIFVNIVGGILLDVLDMKIISAIGIFIYLTSTIIFYFTYTSMRPAESEKAAGPELADKQDTTTQSIKKEKGLKLIGSIFKDYHPILIEGLMGLSTILSVLWSVFAYNLYQSFTIIGTLSAIITLSSILGTFFLRKISTKKHFGIVLTFAILITAILWVFRIYLIQNEWIVFAIGVVLGFLQPIYMTTTYSAYFKYYYKSKSREDNLIKKDLYRKVPTLPIILICFLSGSLSFSIPFVGALFGLATLKGKPISDYLNRDAEDQK